MNAPSRWRPVAEFHRIDPSLGTLSLGWPPASSHKLRLEPYNLSSLPYESKMVCQPAGPEAEYPAHP